MDQLQLKPVRFLEGKQIYLRPIQLEDVETYYQKLFDPTTRYLTGTKNSFTQDQVQQYFEAKSQDSSQLFQLIALKDSDEVIGDIELQDINGNNRSAHLRIMIDATQHQGKGYGTEAILLMLEHAFGIMNLHRIELNVYSFNERAIHVYEKIGFKKEGVQRDALYYHHRYHNSILMGILEDEYRQLHHSS